MTFYAVQLTPQARAVAMVACVVELEAMRDKLADLPEDHPNRWVDVQGMTDLQAALESLRAAEPVEDHPTPLGEAPLDELQARIGALVDRAR